MKKIQPIRNPSLVNPLIASKINEIIGVVNSLALSDKEETIYHTKCDCIYYNGILTKCALHTEPKQSTSLKDAIQDLLLDYKHTQYNGKPKYLTCGEVGDRLISLIQSQLLKEIDKLEVQIVDDWTKEVGKQIGYSLNKEDIINIINNIIK